MAYQVNSHPIPLWHLKEEQRQKLETTEMRESLAVLRELAGSKSGHVIRPLAMELNPLLGKGLASGFVIQRAWCEISVPDIKGIFIHVRSRLLDFLLELRDTVGESATDADLKQKASTMDASGLFNKAVFGAGATIMVGHGNTQTVEYTINKGDIPTLSRRLTQLGVSDEEITRLTEAMESDRAAGKEPSFDGETDKWYTGLLARAAQGAAGIGVDVVTNSVAKALTSFIG